MGCAPSSSRDQALVNSAKGEPLDDSFSHLKDEGKVEVIFVLGGPASGKTTYCERFLKDRPDFMRLTVIGVLQTLRTQDNKYGKEVQELLSQQKIIPTQLSMKCLKYVMKENGWNAKKYLIEGFPKNQMNVNVWENSFRGLADVKGTIYLECNKKTMEERIAARAPTSGKPDDQPANLAQRMQVWNGQTLKTIKQFEKKNAIRKINSERNEDQVYADFKNTVEDLVKPQTVQAPKTETQKEETVVPQHVPVQEHVAPVVEKKEEPAPAPVVEKKEEPAPVPEKHEYEEQKAHNNRETIQKAEVEESLFGGGNDEPEPIKEEKVKAEGLLKKRDDNEPQSVEAL